MYYRVTLSFLQIVQYNAVIHPVKQNMPHLKANTLSFSNVEIQTEFSAEYCTLFTRLTETYLAAHLTSKASESEVINFKKLC